MADDFLPALAKAATDPALLREVYGDLLKPGVAQVGKALGGIIGLGNTVLWPVHLLNERSRIALEANLERYRQRLADVPTEKIDPISPEVGVPIAERLTYLTDPDLREMYTALLSRASIAETKHAAHPSFVNVLNNLTPDEAQLVRQLFSFDGQTPFISVQSRAPGQQGFMELADVYFRLNENVRLVAPHNLSAYISNLRGLGLIRLRADMHLLPKSIYVPLIEDMNLKHKQLTDPPHNFTLEFPLGKIDMTNFGMMFFSACAG
jgi:hypothetical protein